MNVAGGIEPSCGCVQRSSASMPVMRSAAQVEDRLVVHLRARRCAMRLAQAVLERDALQRVRVHERVEELVVVAAELPWPGTWPCRRS